MLGLPKLPVRGHRWKGRSGTGQDGKEQSSSNGDPAIQRLPWWAAVGPDGRPDGPQPAERLSSRPHHLACHCLHSLAHLSLSGGLSDWKEPGKVNRLEWQGVAGARGHDRLGRWSSRGLLGVYWSAVRLNSGMVS